jgi:hypothetical protein
VARRLSLAKKHPSFSGHPNQHFLPDLAPSLYKPERGFRGEGEARLGWELLLSSKARAVCKGAGCAFQTFPASSRVLSEQRGEEAESFPRRSLNDGLRGAPRVWDTPHRGEGGAGVPVPACAPRSPRQDPEPQAGCPVWQGGRKRGLQGTGTLRTPESGAGQGTCSGDAVPSAGTHLTRDGTVDPLPSERTRAPQQSWTSSPSFFALSGRSG